MRTFEDIKNVGRREELRIEIMVRCGRV